MEAVEILSFSLGKRKELKNINNGQAKMGKKSSTSVLVSFTEEYSSWATPVARTKATRAVTFTDNCSISSDSYSSCGSECAASVLHTDGELRARLLRANYLNTY